MAPLIFCPEEEADWFKEWKRLVNFWLIADGNGDITIDDTPAGIDLFVEWFIGTDPRAMANWILIFLGSELTETVESDTIECDYLITKRCKKWLHTVSSVLVGTFSTSDSRWKIGMTPKSVQPAANRPVAALLKNANTSPSNGRTQQVERLCQAQTTLSPEVPKNGAGAQVASSFLKEEDE
jgi:hypothetical protein